jgi:uncharacterized membrane protein (DUF485 family)
MSEQRRSDPLDNPSDDTDVWSAVQENPEYRELRAAQRRFLIPASVAYLVIYFGFLLLTLSAPTLFQQSLHGGLNVGFVLMTAMFVLVWVAVLVHNSVARRYWDPRNERVRAQAGRQGTESAADRSVTS